MSEENLQASSQVTAQDTDIWEQFLLRGLNVVMTQSHHKEIRKNLLREYPEVILPRLDLLDFSIQNSIVETIIVENPNLLIEDEGWWNYLCRSISNLESLDSASFFERTGLYVLLNRAKDLREEVDWYDILLKLSESVIAVGSKCQGFSTTLGWLTQANTENLRTFLYRTETKSYSSALKNELYKMAIDEGILDVKLARRIRSDTSGTLSSEMLAYLFENRANFSDEVFQDLVTQFSDTKHKWVARYIAMNMPMHLAPFLMGIKDDTALKILERRMELAEDDSNG